MNSHGNPLLEENGDQIQFRRSSAGTFNEARVRDLIHARPELLPFEEVREPDFGEACSLGVEINIATRGPGRFLDVLLINGTGRLTVVETKLFTNPEARREALGQIIEYASLLQQLDYETFAERVRASRNDVVIPPGADPLVTIARDSGVEIDDEAAFHDTLQDDLQRGRFLLLVVGEGIKSNLASMKTFLDRTAHMAFTLGMVELRHYSSTPPGRELWVPQVIGRVNPPVERHYVTSRDDLAAAASVRTTRTHADESAGSRSGQKRTRLSEIEANAAFLRRFDSVTEEPIPHTLRSLIARSDDHGLTSEITTSGGSLVIRAVDEITEYPYNLLTVDKSARLGSTDFLEWQLAFNSQDTAIAVRHYEAIATLFGGASRVPSPTKNNPDRHQIKSKDGAPPLFSSAIDQGMEPTDFLDRLFEILERTATEIREAHARK